MTAGPSPSSSPAAERAARNEVGALSGLLPELEARGDRVSLWCGTGVGAINALFASHAELHAADLTDAAEDGRRALVKGDVVARARRCR